MAITGAHVLLHTHEPDAVRTTLRDVMGWEHVDAGGGWLIFALPPAELGVHPGDSPSHELSLLCDDLDSTVRELREKGIQFRGDVQDRRFGQAITMLLPGNLEVLLYEPRRPTAI